MEQKYVWVRRQWNSQRKAKYLTQSLKLPPGHTKSSYADL